MVVINFRILVSEKLFKLVFQCVTSYSILDI